MYFVDHMHANGIGVILDWVRHISREMRTDLEDLMACRFMSIRIQDAASIRTGEPISLILEEMRSLTS